MGREKVQEHPPLAFFLHKHSIGTDVSLFDDEYQWKHYFKSERSMVEQILDEPFALDRWILQPLFANFRGMQGLAILKHLQNIHKVKMKDEKTRAW